MQLTESGQRSAYAVHVRQTPNTQRSAPGAALRLNHFHDVPFPLLLLTCIQAACASCGWEIRFWKALQIITQNHASDGQLFQTVSHRHETYIIIAPRRTCTLSSRTSLTDIDVLHKTYISPGALVVFNVARAPSNLVFARYGALLT